MHSQTLVRCGHKADIGGVFDEPELFMSGPLS